MTAQDSDAPRPKPARGFNPRSKEMRPTQDASDWRQTLHTVIFEADTPAGKAFDVLLLITIVASILVVMFDSVESIGERYGSLLFGAEWFFTALFTIEYVLRLISVRRPRAYALSFFGLVDLASILPTLLALVIVNAQGLVVIRALRILRVFRVLKLARFSSEAINLRRALWVSREKVIVFLIALIILVTILGSCMYLIEGSEAGFDSIPLDLIFRVRRCQFPLATSHINSVSAQNVPYPRGSYRNSMIDFHIPSEKF